MMNNELIEIRCKKCGRHFMDYMIQNDDSVVVMQAISMKCNRCKTVIVFKKYTEGFLISHSKKNIFKI